MPIAFLQPPHFVTSQLTSTRKRKVYGASQKPAAHALSRWPPNGSKRSRSCAATGRTVHWHLGPSFSYTIVKTLRLPVAESVARPRQRIFAYCPSVSKTQVSPTLRIGLLVLCARYREPGSRLRVQVRMSDKEPTRESSWNKLSTWLTLPSHFHHLPRLLQLQSSCWSCGSSRC